MADDIEILQEVRVYGVTVEGADVHVDVYGGRAITCAGIRFTFADESRRRAAVELIRRWQRDETALTFVAAGDSISLQNDLALIPRD